MGEGASRTCRVPSRYYYSVEAKLYEFDTESNKYADKPTAVIELDSCGSYIVPDWRYGEGLYVQSQIQDDIQTYINSVPDSADDEFEVESNTCFSFDAVRTPAA